MHIIIGIFYYGKKSCQLKVNIIPFYILFNISDIHQNVCNIIFLQSLVKYNHNTHCNLDSRTTDITENTNTDNTLNIGTVHQHDIGHQGLFLCVTYTGINVIQTIIVLYNNNKTNKMQPSADIHS